MNYCAQCTNPQKQQQAQRKHAPKDFEHIHFDQINKNIQLQLALAMNTPTEIGHKLYDNKFTSAYADKIKKNLKPYR